MVRKMKHFFLCFANKRQQKREGIVSEQTRISSDISNKKSKLNFASLHVHITQFSVHINLFFFFLNKKRSKGDTALSPKQALLSAAGWTRAMVMGQTHFELSNSSFQKSQIDLHALWRRLMNF